MALGHAPGEGTELRVGDALHRVVELLARDELAA